MFPIDLTSVEHDHDFLDQDSIQALLRRLQILNKCVTMKIESSPRHLGDDSDEEDQCAISDKWQYQRSSRRWSRKLAEDAICMSPSDSCIFPSQASFPTFSHTGTHIENSSRESATSDNDHNGGYSSASSHESPAIAHKEYSSNFLPDSPLFPQFPVSPTSPLSLSPPLPPVNGTPRNTVIEIKPVNKNTKVINNNTQKQEDKMKSAKSFLKRLDSFKSKRGGSLRKKHGKTLNISSPISPVDSPEFQSRIEIYKCVDVETAQKTLLKTSTTVRRCGSSLDSRDRSKRFGIVFSEPSSPVSHRKLDALKTDCESNLNKNFVDSEETLTGDKDSGESGINENGSKSPWHLNGPVKKKSSSKCDEELWEESFYHLRGRSSSFYDNVPDDNKASLDYSDIYEECFENDLKSEIYKLQNLGQKRVRCASTPAYLDDDWSDLSPYLTESDEEIFTEKQRIFDDINNLSVGSKDLNDEPLQRDRSSSLPVQSTTFKLSEEQLNSGNDIDPYDEVEMLLNGINESINEMQETFGISDSSMSSVSSQLSLSHESEVSPFPSPFPSPLASPLHSPLQSPNTYHTEKLTDGDTGIEATSSCSGLDTTGSVEELKEPEEQGIQFRERRDSGVGSSLTRQASGKRTRIRWHSFQKSHRPSLNSRPFQINNMSVGQLMYVRKLSLLRLTALMERYSVSCRSGWSWMMPRFMKRIKTPDYKDKKVFGVPLSHCLQKTGQPLPQTILYAMRYLRRVAKDSVGIFRKPGVRSRIQQIKKLNETNIDVNYEGMMAYDVADMLKQYFRELPEPLLTSKLHDTFLSIFTAMPKDQHLSALQAAIMLLPDENREVLQSLVLFLSDIATHSLTNQMTPYNLAVCFAPSLFHLSPSPNQQVGTSPRRTRANFSQRPEQRELSNNIAANECLKLMIKEVKKLFMVPEETITKCHFSYIDMGEPVTLEELGRKKFDETADYNSYLESCIQGVLKESREKFKGWIPCTPLEGVDVAFKKVGDEHPLRLWKCSVEVEAPPLELLHRILNERYLWDEDLLKWRVVEKLNKQTEVYQYVVNSMAPHPTRDYCILRSWRMDLPKGACVLVSTSVDHPDAPLIGGIRGTVLASRFLIDPCGSGKSKITYMCRVDTKGRTVEWYNKSFGHILATMVSRIRDSFKQPADGPETKV
ncbi:rho GTPase-activating protein 7-like isoform X2 [Anneissia japonica]|nr:rho GTPase-activating protein 7-like isoform X2 [Anneissia japonica]XP_033101301.1 rho GTPase-activating protein 7-like isoform X2 [Anneissia japonica]